MSVNLTTLFTRLGRLIRWQNLWLTYQGTSLLGAAPNGAADDILTQYDARRDLIPNGESFFKGAASSVAGWNATLKGYADATLKDLQSTLSAPNNAPATILPLLVADMVAQSATVQANAISAPAVTIGGANVGTGKLIVSKKNLAGADDERIITETVALTCTADQYTGAVAGAESFSVVGFPALGSPNVSGARGNGAGPALTVADSKSLLTNGNFETWTVTNTPDNWTITGGAVTTNVVKEIVNFHTGAAALKLLGDGATASIGLKQVWAGAAGTIYVAGVWARKSGTVTAGSTLAVTVTGTGVSTKTVLSLDPNSLTTSYVFYSAFFSLTTVAPADLAVNVAWTTAATAGASAVILIDDVVIARPTAFGNCQYAAFRGAVDFLKGDAFSVATANDYAGVIQTWAGRWLGVQLPSSGSPSISDSLAT